MCISVFHILSNCTYSAKGLKKYLISAIIVYIFCLCNIMSYVAATMPYCLCDLSVYSCVLFFYQSAISDMERVVYYCNWLVHNSMKLGSHV